MPLPAGVWKANINGFERSLQINAPNQSGVLTVQVPGVPDVSFDGFWDEPSQTITFSFTLQWDTPGKPVVAMFKGFLFRTPTSPAPGQDTVATLTGFVQMSTATSLDPTLPATSRRNVFGWFAQITELN
jgi:hypothetical protein